MRLRYFSEGRDFLYRAVDNRVRISIVMYDLVSGLEILQDNFRKISKSHHHELNYYGWKVQIKRKDRKDEVELQSSTGIG